MRCPHCQAVLGQVSAGGDPMLRTRGLVLKADGVVAVCPKCRGDVPASGEFRKALILFLTRPPARQSDVAPPCSAPPPAAR